MKDPLGYGTAVVQVRLMMKFHLRFYDYWRCVRCGKRVSSEATAMKHDCERDL